jgi:hypothetical protein
VLPVADYQDWFESYWAKDLQELFRLERRAGLQRLMELLFIQSGGIFEASSFTSPCGISRPTVSTYLAILEETMVVHVLRPFHSSRSREVIQAPKVYGFDTGFVCHHRGWESLREDDLGSLWEHLVLNELKAHAQGHPIHYWRDKNRHELDFVVARNPSEPMAIEVKWRADAFDAANLGIFRKIYPAGLNFLVAHDVDQPFTRSFGNLKVRILGPGSMGDLFPSTAETPGT